MFLQFWTFKSQMEDEIMEFGFEILLEDDEISCYYVGEIDLIGLEHEIDFILLKPLKFKFAKWIHSS